MTINLNYFIIVVLGIWLFLSIIAQFRGIKWIKWVKDKDSLALIPSWTFFAPNPGVTDYKLLYRDRLFNGQFNNWKEVAHRNNSILNFIWNPDKRRQKAIADSCRSLLQTANKNSENKAILSSAPYLTIMAYIMNMPKNSLYEYRLFLIVRTFGYISSKPPDILFLSYLHKLSSDT
jgi:hypothetical protein